MFKIRWLRRFVRRNTNPIHYDVAESRKLFLSRVYAFIAANAAALVFYVSYTENIDITGRKNDPDLTQAKRYSYLSKGKPIDVIEIRGLSVTKHYVLSEEEVLQPPTREEIARDKVKLP